MSKSHMFDTSGGAGHCGLNCRWNQIGLQNSMKLSLLSVRTFRSMLGSFFITLLIIPIQGEGIIGKTFSSLRRTSKFPFACGGSES